jgi:serine protease Do
VSFAIPIDLAARIKDQIVATGKVEHARLGVAVQEVNQSLADSFKLDKPEGALVASVEKGSPADKAGLQAGDVIRASTASPSSPPGDLPAALGLARPATGALEVWRQGKKVQITANWQRADEKVARPQASDDTAGQASWAWPCARCSPTKRSEAGVATAWWSNTSAARRRRPACSRATWCWPSTARP